MASFKNDYSFLAHPQVMNALSKHLNELNITYGLDIHSANAANKIKEIFSAHNSDVHFLVGGTQTNLTFISYCLKNYEGVISSDTGHINVHETAAVEASGHKIILVKNVDGKISSQDVEQVMKEYNNEHMVKPKMVYISNSTELGTIYYKDELISLYETCKKYHLYLFIDGARLGAALTSKYNDIEPNILAKYSDAFYIGGTKNGAMIGEALVINNDELKADFRYQIKSRGAMLAKGYVIGIQFEELFSNNLYFDIARDTNKKAEEVKALFTKYNYETLPSPTNQIFVTLAKDKALKLLKEFDLEKWSETDSNMTVRLVTSFMSNEQDIKELDTFLKNL